MADHTAYSKDPMERLTIEAPPTYSQVVHGNAPPYQPTNTAMLPEVRNSPNVIMAPPTSAPVVTVTRVPRANEEPQQSSGLTGEQIRKVTFLVFMMAFIFSLVGTPLMLFIFVPSMCCICKAKREFDQGKLTEAGQHSAMACKSVIIGVIVSLPVFTVILVSIGIIIIVAS